ncbi:MAG: LamG-like jellyroll fold domain-containing protein [Myxococcota bacterium]
MKFLTGVTCALVVIGCKGGDDAADGEGDGGNACGDGICDFPVDCTNCPEDCIAGECGGGACGDGTCDVPGDCMSCPEDCTKADCVAPGDGMSCDNGACDLPADCFSCADECLPEDCETCGNATCDAPVDCDICPEECTGGECKKGSSCGNSACDVPYDCFICPEDCPPEVCESGCGDGLCNPKQDCEDCVEDCSPEECGLSGIDAPDVDSPDGGGSPDSGTPDSGTPDSGPPCETIAAEFPLNEAEGSATVSGGGVTGTLVGSEGIDYLLDQSGPGGFGSAIFFDGGRVEVGGLTTIPEKVTIEMMVQPAVNGTILRWTDDDSFRGLVIAFQGGLAQVSFCTGSCEGLSTWSGPAEIDGWGHLAVVRERETIRLYVEGTLQTELTAASGDAILVNQPLRFGTAYDSSDDFQGSIAWFRLRFCAGSSGSSFAVPVSE